MRNPRQIALFLLICVAIVPAYAQPQVDREVLFQTSTLHALLEGVYDGDVTFGELKRHGDVGIGTFNALDGEMIALNGRFYQIKSDGVAYPVEDAMKTPFACVTFFDADQTLLVDKPTDLEHLTQRLDMLLPTTNLPYAIKIVGTFTHIKTRSVPAQRKPYPRLVEVVKHQPTFEFKNVSGTIIGFRLPKYMDGLNVPGYHLHFITRDRTAGGHLLECTTGNVRIEIDATPALHLVLPEHGAFASADLTQKKASEVEKIEK